MKKRYLLIYIILFLLFVVVALFLFKDDAEIDFTVKYMIEDEVYITQINKLEKPADPEKEGYEFVGWYYNDELFDFQTKIKKDIVLEAKFSKIKLEVPKEETNNIENNQNQTNENTSPNSPPQIDQNYNNGVNDKENTPSSDEIGGSTEKPITPPIEYKYTYEIFLINNDSYTMNRLVKVYCNDEEVKTVAIYGTYNGKENYKLGIYSNELNGIKLVSYKQFEISTNYVVELSDGSMVSINEK